MVFQKLMLNEFGNSGWIFVENHYLSSKSRSRSHFSSQTSRDRLETETAKTAFETKTETETTLWSDVVYLKLLQDAHAWKTNRFKVFFAVSFTVNEHILKSMSKISFTATCAAFALKKRIKLSNISPRNISKCEFKTCFKSTLIKTSKFLPLI
jgi:hypothetical protein